MHLFMFQTVVGVVCFLPLYELSLLVGGNSIVYSFLFAAGQVSSTRTFIMLCWLFVYSAYLIFSYAFSVIKRKYTFFEIAAVLNMLFVLYCIFLKIVDGNYIDMALCATGGVTSCVNAVLTVKFLKTTGIDERNDTK